MRVVLYDLRDPRAGEVLVEVALSGVSPGTELRAIAGKQPGADGPFVGGYAAVGTVVAGEAAWTGRRVFAGGSDDCGPFKRLWGGHQSHAIRAAARLTPLPDGLDFRDAALGKLAAIALHGARLVPDPAGRDAAVIGLGAIGQFSARSLAALGADVVAVDRSPSRVEAARAGGVEAVLADDRPLVEVLRDRLPDGAEVVVDATGSPAVAAQAVGLARAEPWGQVTDRRPVYVVQGSLHGAMQFDYLAAFERELTVLVPRDMVAADLADALAMLADGRLSAAGVLGDAVPPEEAADVYERLRDPAQPAITFAFDWRETTA